MSAKLERMLREELQINIAIWPCGILPNFHIVVFCPVGFFSLFILCDFVCKEYVL